MMGVLAFCISRGAPCREGGIVSGGEYAVLHDEGQWENMHQSTGIEGLYKNNGRGFYLCGNKRDVYCLG